jgi:uncharacterized protein
MHRASFTAAILLAALVAGCADAPDAPPTSAAPVDERLDADGFVRERFAGVTFLEQDLGGGEGSLRLHADIYLPSQPLEEGAPEKFPTILLLSPYWGAGTQGEPIGYMPYDFLVHRLLPRGYAIVFGDLGGNGGSSGCWDFMGPVERASAYAMVEAIAAQDWSDGQVGMFGLSYDGMTQIMAASDQAPHLVTVVPAAALTEAYRGLKMHGVHYGGGWHATIASYEASSLLGPGPTSEQRRPGWIETVQQNPGCMAGNHSGDQATGAYTDYYKARDFRPFGRDVKASVFVTQGFEDGAVKPDNHGTWFDDVPTLKKLWIGHWYHQYPTAANAGRDDLYLTFHRWFDHVLYRVDNGIDREPMVDVQDSLGRWRHEDQWPPADATVLPWSPSSDGSLQPPTQAQEGALPFGGPQGATGLVLADSMGTLRLETAPLGADLHIAGTPVLEADFTPGQASGYVVARLFDGDRMITQGAANALFANGLDAPQPLQPGTPVRLRIAFYPTDWVVPAGGTLRLELTTVDGRGWFDPDPSLASFDLRTGADARLDLPVIANRDAAVFLTSCGTALDAMGVDCKDPALKDQGVPSDD